MFDDEAEIARLISLAKLKKEEAKDLREDGDVEGAIETLEDVVTTLERSPLSQRLLSMSAPDEPYKKLAFHLADCLGMLGGNYRRLDRRAEAQAAFLRGRAIEESEKLEVPSSYNLVNAITLPIETDGRISADLRAALQRAIAAISRQVIFEERRKDRWAWADLGECQLLLGELKAAEKSYERVRELGNDETRASVVGVLQRLAHALASDARASTALAQAMEWMRPSTATGGAASGS